MSFDAEEVLARVEGDRELLAELLDLFAAETGRLLADLREGVAAGDAAGVERAAHALRGCVGNFGAPGASRLALELEWRGREGDLAGAAALLEELAAEVAELAAGLARLAAGAAS